MKWWVPASLALWLVASAPPVSAAETPENESKRWEVTIAPYLWGSAVDSTLTADGSTVEFSAGLDDVLRALDPLAAMGAVELRYDRFLLGVDVVWAALGGSAEAGRTPLGPLVGVDVHLDQILLTPVVGYRLVEHELPRWKYARPEAPARFLRVDAYAGARWWYLHTDVDLAVPVLGLGVKFDDTIDWWDMVLGLRLGIDLGERLDLVLGGDVGGFGIASSSDFAWNAAGSFGYRLARRWTLRLGYRALETERGPLELLLQGPTIGVTYRF